MSILSIVIPAYNESVLVNRMFACIGDIMSETNLNYEIIFVDDGSSDDTWFHIETLSNYTNSVVGVKLSRNFGKEGAILAGLTYAVGEAVIIIDCDMQHPVEKILDMVRIWQSDANIDVIEAIKSKRGDESKFYALFSKIFYATLKHIGNVELENRSDFQLLSRRVVEAILRLPENQRFFRGLSAWVGFNRAEIYFDVAPRMQGTTKWSFLSSFKYAIANITSFSTAPLQIVTLLGIIFLLAATLLGGQTIVSYITNRSVEGFTTVILLLLTIGGLMLIALGIIGVYIAKIYEEVKRRPNFLVSKVSKKGTA